MKAHLLYLRYVMRHKWFVFRECCRLGIPLAGIIHDWSKFTPSEWIPYVHYFYGSSDDQEDRAFDMAWLLHQKRNPHHWQWWVLPEDSGAVKALPMPDRYRREMLADWRGAGLAQGTPDTLKWYAANRDKMTLHPETRDWIEQELDWIGTRLKTLC